MDQYSTDLIEKTIIGCIFTKPKLLEETFIKEEYFINTYARTVFKLSLEIYNKNQKLDLILMYQEYQKYLGNNFVEYIHNSLGLITTTTIYNDYQEKLFDIYKNGLIVK